MLLEAHKFMTCNRTKEGYQQVTMSQEALSYNNVLHKFKLMGL